MVALNGFDATKVAPTADMTPLPEGAYKVRIENDSVKPTRAGDGEMLAFVYEVLEGEYKGRKIFDNLCIKHPNVMTVSIARANLSAICHAVGVLRPTDTVQLHNIPFMVRVVLQRQEETGKTFNTVKAYNKVQSAVQVAPPTPAPQPMIEPQMQAEAVVDNTAPIW